MSNSSLKDTAMSLPPSAEVEISESFAQGGSEGLLAKHDHALSTFHSLQPSSSALQIAACSDRMIPKSQLLLQELQPVLQSHPKVLGPFACLGLDRLIQQAGRNSCHARALHPHPVCKQAVLAST